MWKALAIALLLAGCAQYQLPPDPQDGQAKRFETVPGKSVIYLVRPGPEINRLHAVMTLDDKYSVTTYSGTFARWEVEPGTHRISGLASDNASITLRTEAGRLYFVQQSLVPGASSAMSSLQVVDEQYGRSSVLQSQLVR